MLAVTLLMPLLAVGQDVTAPALKAAFIYNFVKFTEWPAAVPVPEAFVICVIGDAAVSEALERVIEGREVAGRRIVVVAGAAPPAKVCRVLYVSGATVDEAGRAIAGLQDSAVLTISDVGGFTDTGGLAQLFFESGRLRFIIKLEGVKRAGLKMSSQLLMLAKR